MYSQNDYRDYLEHKWTWPGGKNSKEYNAHYYQTHKEKWKKGLEKTAKAVGDAIGINQKKELTEEEERLRKWKRRAEGEKEFIDHVNSTAREMRENYKKTGNEGSKQAAIFASRYGGDLQRDFYESGSYNTPATKHLSEQANKVAKIKNSYKKTPLYKIEKFTEPGRKALNSVMGYMDKLVDDLTNN